MGKENVVDMHNAYSAIGKEQNPAICTNKDGIEGLSAK
jgi:hypothetical protein